MSTKTNPIEVTSKVEITNFIDGDLVEPSAPGTPFWSNKLEYRVQFGDKLLSFQPYSFNGKRIGSKYITEDPKEVEFLNKLADKDGHVSSSRPKFKLA